MAPSDMAALKKLQRLQLVSKVSKELENHMNISETAVAEFMIALAEASANVDKFKQKLAKEGAPLPDALTERLWNIIQHLAPSEPTDTAAGAKPHPHARPGAAIPGLALENTREYARRIDEELVREGAAHGPADGEDTVAAVAAAAVAVVDEAGPSGRHRDRDRGGGQDRERRRDREQHENGHDRGDRDHGRERDGGRDGQRDRERERGDRERDRGDGERGKDRDRDRERDREQGRERDRGDRGDRERDRDDRDGRRHERERSSSRERKRRRRSRSASPERGERVRDGGGRYPGPPGGGRPPMPPPSGLPEAPELGGVYRGVVSGIMDNGCFVELSGFRRKVVGAPAAESAAAELESLVITLC